jgi:hypothetical protein
LTTKVAWTPEALFDEMSRAVVNVATGRYVVGQQRLRAAVAGGAEFICWADAMPPGSPAHKDVPYAFKAFAIDAARQRGFRYVLWADSSIRPIRPLDPLWDLIERQGYWISRNYSWNNFEWTWPTAYAALDVTPEENLKIPQIIATSFGLDLQHPKGARFFEEYLRLARTTAFCGPWFNTSHPDYAQHGQSWYPCGECPDLRVRGHRHDQTAASLIAHRLDMTLTDPPKWIDYPPSQTADTILWVDGNY